MLKIKQDTFTFGSINSSEFGIKVISYDPFSPPKRRRSRVIDFRHGSFDLGTKFYSDRIITLECHATHHLGRAELRKVSFWLSGRDRLILWDEPDKYYIGELMDSADVAVAGGRARHRFVLPFVCEPFAYGQQVIKHITGGENAVEYGGEADAPTMLVIRNQGTANISNIVVKAVSSINR